MTQIKVAREAAMQEKLAGYSDAEQAELLRVLRRLAKTLLTK